ncbi:carbohydrate ABC transporter permease [Myceligenerans xiligouense]|uniref:Carbohydrate ABC transporter membrane protein 2 (CUT1 family) n=1 Tax=Myceligenerans xiligouense TaxID=253184 RepID=A0A3N4ZQ42_9MICO|nr:carbohydrate ABC transporter permease [Myceligenerans xiligouense]RPF23105.1 carbohydrate ABC transporter membrane protein 2 (CUT1 family) [Myceligenerans xiligouense]
MVTTDVPDIARVREVPRTVKDTASYTVFRVVNACVLLIICGVTLYPFVNLAAKAFSSQGYIMAGQVNLWPRGFNLTTLEWLAQQERFWTGYGNTIIQTVGGTTIAMVLTTTMAYALAKKHLKGRGIVVAMVVVTMFFNGGLIPNYLLITNLGFKNTVWAIIIPNAISAFNLLVMKAFFENFPSELEEAAAIDGMTTYGIFFRIVLPLSKAVIATMILFYAVFFWNSWFPAMLYLSDADLQPVTLYLRNLLAGASGAGREAGMEEVQIGSNLKAVTMLLTVVPIIAVYPFVQKYFVTGVMLGSVKG